MYSMWTYVREKYTKYKKLWCKISFLFPHYRNASGNLVLWTNNMFPVTFMIKCLCSVTLSRRILSIAIFNLILVSCFPNSFNLLNKASIQKDFKSASVKVQHEDSSCSVVSQLLVFKAFQSWCDLILLLSSCTRASLKPQEGLRKSSRASMRGIKCTLMHFLFFTLMWRIKTSPEK